ncbi:MAG: hypothetical protein WBH68_01830 [Erysipelotrichaceae bacterium]|jgi:hypothetical protein|nr:hypothetical protein [Bacillota bacterium]
MKTILLNLYIVGANKLYKVNFSVNKSLMDNITIFYNLINDELKDKFILDKYILVYENISNKKINLFVKIKDLNLIDNSILIIY